MKIRDIITERLDPRQVRNWTPEQWNQWLDTQLKNGSVYKADWTDAKAAISRQVERAANEAAKIYLQLDHTAREPYNDLYWDQPHGLSELGKAEKTANRSPDGAFKSAMMAVITDYRPLKAKLDQLKPLIVTAQQQRDTAKQQRADQQRAAEGASEALVTALEENRNQYVAEARRRAEEWITGQKDKLAERGGANAVQQPTRKLATENPEAYQKQMRAYNYAQWLDKMPVERYVEMEGQGADESYAKWIYKLVQKIGKPVTHADVSGDPWTGSRITVQTNDGDTQSWNTQMILNRSKLGKVFHQFPTRRAK